MALNRYAIINGDDFGFSHGVNQAIIQAHTQGILTSTSLMVTGDAFEAAVALAKAHPSLAVGLHLVLGCGKSVLPPAQIPHLVDDQGHFPENPTQAGLRYQFNRAAQRELRLEIRAQLERFHQTGLPLSHVDGHLHHHVNPAVLTVLVDLAKEFQIPAMRLPSEELGISLKVDSSQAIVKTITAMVFGGLRRYGQTQLTAQGIGFANRVYGLLQTGHLSEDYLLGLIPQIRAQVVEIYAHPAIPIPGEPANGPVGAGEQELAALLSQPVRDAFARHGFELASYSVLKDRTRTS